MPLQLAAHIAQGRYFAHGVEAEKSVCPPARLVLHCLAGEDGSVSHNKLRHPGAPTALTATP